MTTFITAKEEKLVQACLQKDRQAQKQLYEQYVRAMYHLAIRMVPDAGTAEDIVQESFIKVFQYLQHYKGEATLGAWIKRITINTCLSHLRKNDRLVFKGETYEQVPTDEQSVRPSQKSQLPKIHAAIKELPSGSRTVLTLHLLEGYQHKEIAEILGITVSTSKTQYRRGRLLLQKILKEKYKL
ncbi:MAG: RNA polymerase sigma factor [Saprospiraceae bacterium]|nr:RNA polymerase sigma factor [Saprospiraceae bacterium]